MKTINKILFLALSTMLFSCEDILEEDITDKTATIITPMEGDVIESNVVTFQWKTMTGADKYRIQVFSQTQVIVVDSLVENKTNITLPLNEGTYHWRVRGENFAYQSSFSFEANFQLQQSDDLSTQQVILRIPDDNAYKNSQTQIVSWDELSAADYYELQVIDVTHSNIILQEPNITATTYSLNSSVLSQDAKYEWKVKAYNTTSVTSTQFSTRSFYLDTVLPNQPLNTLPANNSAQVLNQTINFFWSIPTDSGNIQSTISYIVEIATDTAFSNIVQTSNPTTSASFQRAFTTAGDYYWRVRAIDAAGNIGSNSTYYKITFN